MQPQSLEPQDQSPEALAHHTTLDTLAPLDLSKPIFAFYLNVEGMSPDKARELVGLTTQNYKYPNITFWIVAIQSGPSRIDLVWDPRSPNTTNTTTTTTTGQLIGPR